VSDSPYATFDYQKVGIPSFWFPIQEMGKWGYSPFYGTLKVVNEYYKGDKPILVHCHAGANRSPTIAYAILLAKGYTPKEAECSIKYPNFSKSFLRNMERKHVPQNVVEFLKKCDEKLFKDTSLHGVLKNMDYLYEEWSRKKVDEQNDYTLIEGEGQTRIIYDEGKKQFVVTDNE
jgi:rhodanese-related sulfurtransferase